MRDTKGLGNFHHLFMYATDGIKILPLSEVTTKDDFFNIKKASRDDLLSAPGAAADDGDYPGQLWRVRGCSEGVTGICTERADAVAGKAEGD
ncbi:hypothetical protein [Erwinia sp. ErVv1]|uniref:hypothetical protein n=1 Tax=Erwinia sp. ErVv1 TaxID=1603299 RepID=UPI00082E0604